MSPRDYEYFLEKHPENANKYWKEKLIVRELKVYIFINLYIKFQMVSHFSHICAHAQNRNYIQNCSTNLSFYRLNFEYRN